MNDDQPVPQARVDTKDVGDESNISVPQEDAQPIDAQAPKRKRYYLVLFDTLSRELLNTVQQKLDEQIMSDPKDTEIHVWLESPGGDAHATYKLVLELRNRCSKLVGVVPDYAKSAATLLLLGVDSIYMAAAAELGPLDVQIEHPDREGLIVSGLDVADSLEFLATTAINMVCAGGATLIQFTGLNRHQVLHESLQFMAQFLQPTVSKLDPHLIHRASQELTVASQYAIRMLKTRALPNDAHMSEDHAVELMRRLVGNYPAHGFVISRDEARRELHLPVLDWDEYPRLQEVKLVYNIVAQRGGTLIKLFDDAELDRLVTVTELRGEETNEEVLPDSESETAADIVTNGGEDSGSSEG